VTSHRVGRKSADSSKLILDIFTEHASNITSMLAHGQRVRRNLFKGQYIGISRTSSKYSLGTRAGEEHLVLYQGCKWKVIEQVREELPHVCIAIFSQALIVETVAV